MAIYHLRATMISRSAGRSATAAAAYRSASHIEDHRTGLSFDYRARGGVDHVEILAPAHAPEWAQDRAALWNAVEAAETRKNSQVARESGWPCPLSWTTGSAPCWCATSASGSLWIAAWWPTSPFMRQGAKAMTATTTPISC
nr:MobA/MobL family protein [Salipiger marinus]